MILSRTRLTKTARETGCNDKVRNERFVDMLIWNQAVSPTVVERLQQISLQQNACRVVSLASLRIAASASATVSPLDEKRGSLTLNTDSDVHAAYGIMSLPWRKNSTGSERRFISRMFYTNPPYNQHQHRHYQQQQQQQQQQCWQKSYDTNDIIV